MKTKSYHHGNLKEALISSGLEIISESGLEALSLRNVAKRIGVSHTAPYNHFSDKQALLAAISTAGHEQLYSILLEVFEVAVAVSKNIIPEIAWTYLQFAMNSPSKFKLMFSGALEEERNHPAFIEITSKTVALFEKIIVFCQSNGQLPAGNVEKTAIKLWSTVHGFTTLMLEKQFPPQYLQNEETMRLLQSLFE